MCGNGAAQAFLPLLFSGGNGCGRMFIHIVRLAMRSMFFLALLWIYMLVGVVVLLNGLSLAWAQERELSADMQAALQESDAQCTGPVLRLEAVQAPLRLCEMQSSNDAPVEWLQSKTRRIRFMGKTLLFGCELDLEAASNIKPLVPAMNVAVRQADKLAQKLVGEDYERVLQVLVNGRNRDAAVEPEKRITLPAHANFHKTWEPVGVFASFKMGTDGQLHSVFFVDWATRERVRPNDEHVQYDVLCVCITDGVLELCP